MKKNLLFIIALLAGNHLFSMEKPKIETIQEKKTEWTAWDETEQEKLIRETEAKLKITKNNKEKDATQFYFNEETSPALEKTENPKELIVLDNSGNKISTNLPLAMPTSKEENIRAVKKEIELKRALAAKQKKSKKGKSVDPKKKSKSSTSEIKELTKAKELQKAQSGKKEKTKKETKKSQLLIKDKAPSMTSVEEQKIAIDLKNDFIKSSKAIAHIANEIEKKQKRSLKKVTACQQEIGDLEKAKPTAERESLIKTGLNLHLAHAESIETNYQLILINSIIEKIYLQKEKIIKQLELLAPDKDANLIIGSFKNNCSSKELCKKLSKVLKNNSDIKEEESLESCINRIAEKLEFTLSSDEIMLLDNAKINPNSFAKYLASNDVKQIETFSPIKDERNNQIIYLHKHDFKSNKTNHHWFQSIKYNVRLWFKDTDKALEQGGYNDPKHKNYHRKESAIPFHTFDEGVDPIAKLHSVLMRQTGKIDETGKKEDDCTLALMPGHIVRDGKVTFGNFEFAFGDTKKCHHRFFNPSTVIKKKKDILQKESTDNDETQLSIDSTETELKLAAIGKIIDLSHIKINKTKDDLALATEMKKKQIAIKAIQNKNTHHNPERISIDSDSDDQDLVDEEYLDLEDTLVRKGKKDKSNLKLG